MQDPKNDTAPVTTPATDLSKPRSFAGLSDIQASMRQFRLQYGEDRVKALSARAGARQVEVVVRAPNRNEYNRHNETMMKLREGKAGQALGATRALLLECTLAPAPAELAQVLDDYPALADKFGESVLDMAGADAEVREETF